jgi:hypothetical protein
MLGLDNVPGKTRTTHDCQDPPAWIRLPSLNPEFCRSGEGVMVRMPALTKGEEAQPFYIETLNCSTIDAPALVTASMGEVTNHPMPGERDRDPHSNTPDHPTGPTKVEEEECPGKLLQQPGAFEKQIEAILLDPIL